LAFFCCVCEPGSHVLSVASLYESGKAERESLSLRKTAILKRLLFFFA